MGSATLGFPLRTHGRDKNAEAVPQVTFDAGMLSAAKAQVLKQTLRNRLLWIAAELLLLVALLTLLIVHSFRLHHHDHNTYRRWSSSWVLILLSVLLVIIALAMFVTFYHFRARLAWIKSPETTDGAVKDSQAHNVQGSGMRAFRFLRRNRTIEPIGPLPGQQRPWLNSASRNSRAWREMRARERDSSLSSPSSTRARSPQLLTHANKSAPRRPPPAGKRRQTADSLPS
ncbi:hypothetical protein LPJ70_004721 [Coemansia sp. RSA 2708]|nr:hypothetical protein LPJ70_004721 [Coemansia sp. RSA 2708]KAJ2318720.1 hypothetical protein IWW52_002399 [Coemansia sp. RSA 2704]